MPAAITRHPVRRSASFGAALLALALVASACSGEPPSQVRSLADRFAEALSTQNVAAAAEITSDPAAATTALDGIYAGLGGVGSASGVTATPRFTVSRTDEDQQTFTLSASWSFTPADADPPESEASSSAAAPATTTTTAAPTASERVWTYTTEGSVADRGAGLQVTWNPGTVVAGLTPDTTVRYTTLAADRVPRVLDASGAPLMSQRVVTLVNLDASANAGAVAALVSPFAPTVTAESLGDSLATAGGSPVTAVTLRDEDIAPIESLLAAIPGVTLSKQTRLLTDNRALASPALNDVAAVWQEQQDATAGWAVQLVGPDGAPTQRLTGEDATTGDDIRVSLDTLQQLKAENALTALPNAAAIVALRPSTGDVVAVAQNAAADAQGPLALTGLYPPGSTFKTVTTSAALQAGEVTPDTVVPCPGSANIEGRTIPNDDNFDLGSVPLTTAFARSCNTTMGQLAVGLPDTALRDAAAQFGLGVDYVTPGLTTVTGSVPPATTPAERVESAIGQGAVTASPFGMALVAASIADGSTPSPVMIVGRPGVADSTPQSAPAQVTEEIRAMMRETVQNGTASELRDLDGLLGKTGTAEVAGGPAHGWFVGIRGDLAFAVFVAGGDSSAPALAAAGRYLR
ncbi:penicillin-binding transpeptidase domain-containing protein [Rhodococcoides corynebacterioides]|uniref:penicillin-binding transpeptidase domain-containing protein n=1 Tax=Rhodococcoides corynebacterioides TaxID=53972 RepID=UPI003F7E5AE6